MKYSNFKQFIFIGLLACSFPMIKGCTNHPEKMDSRTPAVIQNQSVIDAEINEKIKLLEASLVKRPNDVLILNDLSYVYASMNDKRSLEYADKMIALTKIEKAASMGHFNKGIYYSNSGKIDSALFEFGAAIEEDYLMTDAYIEKAILLYDLKQFDASYALLEKATVINKYIPTLYFWMGKNKQEMGQKDAAIYFYQQCLELKPTEAESSEAEEMIKKLKE